MSYEIRKVSTQSDLEKILPLITQYQEFYKVKTDPDATRQHFKAYLNDNAKGAILGAFEGNRGIAFTTLYFLPSSLSASYYCCLNDLFVDKEFRSQGLARELIKKAAELSTALGYKQMDWMTQKENVTAQSLYFSLCQTHSEWIYFSAKVDELL